MDLYILRFLDFLSNAALFKISVLVAFWCIHAVKLPILAGFMKIDLFCHTEHRGGVIAPMDNIFGYLIFCLTLSIRFVLRYLKAYIDMYEGTNYRLYAKESLEQTVDS